MDKAQIAEILDEIGTLLELKGENPFKSRAYHNAAHLIGQFSGDLSTLVRDEKLSSIKGIGPGLSEKIAELVITGKSSYYDELNSSLPEGLLEIIRVQGVGPKRAKILHDKLKIKDISGLQKACEEGKIAKLEGFGEKSQENILKGIGFLSRHAEYFRYDTALAAGNYVMDELRKLSEVKQITLCGSLRRRKEVVRDVDILVSSSKPEPIMKHFVALPDVERVLGRGETKSSVLLHSGIQVDLRILKEPEYPFAMHYFTGSKEHNIRMRQIAQNHKLKLSEYGLFDDKGRSVVCKSEQDIFKKLDLVYIPPELREDRGEIEAAQTNTLPRLVEYSDIKGVFHVHSTWSDGRAPLEDMIAEAERLGWEYVGISDHSKSATYANGLSEERVSQQRVAIEQFRKRFKIHIFWGTECDILKDGSLDYPDKILANYDFVIASVHSNFNLSEKEMTQRVTRALQNKYVTFLGHMTGRLLLRREPYLLNIPQVLDAAAAEQVAVEINSHPNRLEIDWRHIPLAKEKGVRFSINPDAHAVEELHVIPIGVGIARKGWLTKEDVITTRSLGEITKWLKS